MNYETLAQEILINIGGNNNIHSFTNCMTRLRVNVKDTNKINVSTLKTLNGVIGVIEGTQTQIIVGPGHAQRLKVAFETMTDAQNNTEIKDNLDYDNLADKTKSAIKNKQTSSVQKTLKSIGNIFVPLIPGLVATGMITAIANIVKTIHPSITTNPWFALFASGGTLLIGILNVLAGHNAAKEFGGTPVIGAIMGALIGSPALSGMTTTATGTPQPLQFIIPFTDVNITLAPHLGGVVGVILAVYLCCLVEKKLRQIIPAVLDLFVIPLLTLLIGGIVTIFVIMPIAALLMNGLIYLLLDVLLNKLGVLGGYLLAAAFLPMVMLGIHQAFIPIHAQLITSQGFTLLLPIMAMAGAGQVGAAFAIFIKTKNPKLKETITSGLPVGILGVGEPLIYGVSLPLFYPFITACLGAGFGGAVIVLGNTIGQFPIGASAIGPSGVLLIPLIANGQWLWYLFGLLVAYFGGFILTYFFGYNDKMLERIK